MLRPCRLWPRSRRLTLGSPSRRLFPGNGFATTTQDVLREAKSISKHSERTDASDELRINTLPNGLRVATGALPGPFSAVGVYVDGGSRYEDERLRGVSHIVDRLAFKATQSRTNDDMIEAFDLLGGNMQCASARESINYQCATFNSAIPTAVGLLADTIRDPLITQQEVEQQLATAAYEVREIEDKPELILPEYLHMTAYKDNTLGNPLLCPMERMRYIDRETVLDYRKFFFQPERIVVAYAGVEHNEAMKLTEKYFGDMPTARLNKALSSDPSISVAAAHPGDNSKEFYAPNHSSASSSHAETRRNLSTSAPRHATASPLNSTLLRAVPQPYPLDLTIAAHYTGGFHARPRLPAPEKESVPALSHIHLAFEALPISSTDIYALATLQTLLGGGGSFSAGGPGKGMYSRLYTNVLNQFGWVESCVAFNHSYTDSGLFGISASCTPGQVRQCLEVMCRELRALTLDSGHNALKEGEVRRAKNQLLSSLLMNLESKMVELEDMGRQVQVHGKRLSTQEMCEKIEALTVHDLRRVAKETLQGYVQNKGKGSGAPTLVIQEGDEEGENFKDLERGEAWERIERAGLGRRGFALEMNGQL